MSHDLDPLLADGVIDEVVARLKSGKEADVWLVRHAGKIVTAKVYRDRHVRSFKNDAAYREGRQVRNTRTQRAMDRGSRFGQAAAQDAWKAKEADALYRLHAAGLRVPQPVLFYEGVLLMELVLDAHGHPAPRLVDAPLAPELAAPIYADIRKQAVGMLACHLIHGDLSPYNVLAGWNGPVVIDFPQVVEAAHNSQAEAFFLRDLQNIHRFCAALDPSLRAAEGDGREIWRAYVRRELSADFVPTGRGVEPARARQGDAGHRPRAPHGGPGPRHDGPRPAQGGPGGSRGGPVQRAGDPGGARPHGRPHPQGGHAAQPGPGGSRGADPRGRRGPPQPEVIRIQRPPHGAHGTGSGAAGGGGQGASGAGQGGSGSGDGRRWGRRRRRR
jgi:RIO kinase 1